MDKENVAEIRDFYRKQIELLETLHHEDIEKAGPPRRKELADACLSLIKLAAKITDAATLGIAGAAIDTIRKVHDMLTGSQPVTNDMVRNAITIDLFKTIERVLFELLIRFDSDSLKAAADAREPRDFMDRPGFFERIRDALNKNRGAALTGGGVQLSGMGGVGKSYLAQTYADRFRDEYDHVLALRADATHTVSGLAHYILAYFGVKPPPPREGEADAAMSERAVVNLAVEQMAEGRGLIVFDNVDADEQIQNLLPPAGSAWHVLITTRDDAMAHRLGGIDAIPVGPFDENELAEFLKRRLGKDDFETHRDALVALCARVENLPLAVEVLIGHVRTSAAELNRGHARAIDDMNTAMTKSLGATVAAPAGTAAPGDVTDEKARAGRYVEAILRISLRHFENEEAAWTLLRALRVADPAIGLQKSMLQTIAQADLAGRAALDRLIHQHVVELFGTPDWPRVRFHPLMLEVISSMDAGADLSLWETDFRIEMTQWLMVVDSLLNQANSPSEDMVVFEEGNLQKAWRDLALGHWGPGVEEYSDSESMTGRFAVLSSQWAELFGWFVPSRLSTFDAMQKALEVGRDTSADKDLLSQAGCKFALGVLCHHTSDLDAARTHYETALPIFREIRARLGEANTRKALGDLCVRTSDLDAARTHYETALPIFREIRDRLGEANTRKALGDLCVRTDDLDAARTHYETALPIFREIRARLGEANTLQSMARTAPDIEKAVEGFRAAVRIHREIQDRMGELADLGYLAHRMAAADRLAEALKATEQSLNLSRSINDVLGDAITLMTQARALNALGEEQAAKSAFILRDIAAVRSHMPDEKEAAARLEKYKRQVGEENWPTFVQGAEAVRKEAVERLTRGIPEF